MDETMAAAQLAREQEGEVRRLTRARQDLATRDGILRASLTNGGDASFGIGWFEHNFLEAGLSRNAARETTVLSLARMQLADGRWRNGLPRVPLQSSESTATAGRSSRA